MEDGSDHQKEVSDGHNVFPFGEQSDNTLSWKPLQSGMVVFLLPLFNVSVTEK